MKKISFKKVVSALAAMTLVACTPALAASAE